MGGSPKSPRINATDSLFASSFWRTVFVACHLLLACLPSRRLQHVSHKHACTMARDGWEVSCPEAKFWKQYRPNQDKRQVMSASLAGNARGRISPTMST